ncbi:ISL3 family transposase [Novosphingobium sp. H3SJ31-1]|uniref:ISL3 family transposase n=1 Tax=Novosphingobium album (ex Liu et al. 2023) TaxID=3031130 RepID=A0ABT5WUY8_9SPHN|nr:ISL3 family transposase [Novosphingobium album (ex Liu et al. 2023)]
MIHCRSRLSAPRCPTCRRVSSRTHSRYQRHVADLPWQGRPVMLCVQVRRLRCINRSCAQRIFAERAEALAGRYARRTLRLRDIERSVGLALGGEAGARLIDRLSMRVSADTMLRIVRTGRQVKHGAPRVLGIDDWAWRKGQRYGTVLVDLEANQVVDLLPDRESATLTAWLKSNPGAEIIARDRAGSYAKGAREGAPLAVQVADRWHMLRNCSDALLAAVEKRYRLVREVGRSLADDVAPVVPQERPATIGASRATLDEQRQSRARRHMMFEAVAGLRDKGWSIAAIAHETGRDRKTIRQWLLDRRPGTWERASRHPANAFEAYLRSRWEEGCRNATQLYREVCGLGYRGEARSFRRWIKTRLRDGLSPPAAPSVARPRWKSPSSRQTVRLLSASSETLCKEDARFVDAVRAASPAIAEVADLARRFHEILVERKAAELDPWLAQTLGSAVASFARGLRRDIDAVRAALTLPWSTGPVEGKINKLKLIKRSMYGRAGIDLLRARIMA